MTDNQDPAMREIVKQALQYSRWTPYVEPVVMDERGQVISPRQAPVDAFLEQLETWGYTVVSLHDPRLQKAGG